jgi:CheY-like chemotaxis protein
MNRDIAAAFIRSAGYEVACADGGAQAITAAATTDFLVVMMDVRMPEIDGLEATRCIRALAGPRGLVPIVALTAQVFTEQIEACRKAGMDTHLGKPFTLETLLGAIDLGVSAGQARSANGALPAAPPPPPKHLLGANLPILDEAALALTAAALPPGAVAAYLATLATKTEAFQQALNRPHAAALCEAAHAIAGSAAMFGFVRLVFLARQFEHAADADPAERRAIAEPLDLALAASLQEMRHRSQPASQRAVA